MKEAELLRLQQQQLLLLVAGSTVIRRGGILVYSSCSLESEENEAVVKLFLHRSTGFVLERESLFLPQRDGCDGGYAAKLVREW